MATSKKAPAKKAAPKKAAPAKKAVAPVKKAAPSKKAAPAKKAAAPKKAAPAKKVAAPVKKATPAKKTAPVKKAAAPKKAAPKKATQANKAVASKKAVTSTKKATSPAKKSSAQVTPAKKAAPQKPISSTKGDGSVAKKANPVKDIKTAKAAKAASKAEVVKPVKEKKSSKKGKSSSPKKTIIEDRMGKTKVATPTPAPEGRSIRDGKKGPSVVARHEMTKKTDDKPKSYSGDFQPEEKRSILDAPEEVQSTTFRYSDEDLNEFRELIAGRLEKARQELTYLQGLITRKDEAGTEDTENRYMNMEDGSGAMEREQLAHLASRQIQFISNLEKAMMRIENKTYGICRVTGKLIDKARLRAVPHATLSIEAKKTMTK